MPPRSVDWECRVEVSCRSVGELTIPQTSQGEGSVRPVELVLREGNQATILVTRTLAQQFADHFDAACRPYQYALSTRSGAEALVHTLQVLTETSLTATVLSVDGVGAYDHVSRQAMLEALACGMGPRQLMCGMTV